MQRLITALILLMLATSPAFAKPKRRQIKVEIPSKTEDRAFKYQGAGLAGAIDGLRTTDQVFMVNTVIDGEHVRLRCYENHKGCPSLGPGVYDGELSVTRGYDKDDVEVDIWISSKIPLSDAVRHDHWRAVGSW